MLVETLASTRSKLKKQLGNRTDVDDPQLNEWINSGMIALAEELEVEDFATSRTITTIAAQPAYVLDPDVSLIMSVSVVDPTDTVYGGMPLAQTELQWYRRQAEVTGVPEYWFVFGGSIILYPTPDSAYSVNIDYAVALTELVLDTDPIPFKPGIGSLVILRARWIAQDALGMPEAALLTQDHYATRLKMLLDRRAKQALGRDRQVSVPHSERQLRLGERAYGLRRRT